MLPGDFNLDMTPAVSRVLEAARRWALLEDDAELQPSHLLQGLLEEEEGRPWQLLSQAGLDPGTLRRSTPVPEESAALEMLPVSQKVREIFRHARSLARGLGEEQSVASEHLLLALLELDDSLRQELQGQGLQLDKLETDVWAAQGPPIQIDVSLLLEEPGDSLQTARIVDAAANRAREALRVLEDYTRFVLDDAFLSGELKRLRHGLADALAILRAGMLLEARDTLGDVGTAISTPQEQQRTALDDVCRAACKRLQEALRSVEEYGKLLNADLAIQVEQLRYRAYTLERALLLGSTARSALVGVQLCVLVSSSLCRFGLESTVAHAIAGGAQMIQLREKDVDDRTLLARAHEVRRLTQPAGVVLIVNDRPDIARLSGADGVHLGQDDLALREARRILGPGPLIGVSTHNIEQLRQAVLDGASYVGVGPMFASGTKNFAELAGIEYLRAALAETSLPAFAIGGISAATLPMLLEAGARRLAVSAAVCQADDPRVAAAELVGRLRDAGAVAP
jgi:thiamine-phosphate pyrophosphorylase